MGLVLIIMDPKGVLHRERKNLKVPFIDSIFPNQQLIVVAL